MLHGVVLNTLLQRSLYLPYGTCFMYEKISSVTEHAFNEDFFSK